MLPNLDYNLVLKIISRVKTLEADMAQLFYPFLEKLSSTDIDFKKRTIRHEELYNFMLNESSLSSLTDATGEPNQVSLDLFLSLYVHLILGKSLAPCKTFKDVLSRLESDSFYTAHEDIQPNIEFFALYYFLRVTEIEWRLFVAGFNKKDWQEINLLTSVFPISFASVDDFLTWIAAIVKQQERDLAIDSIGKSISEWVFHKPDEGKEVEANLEKIANFPSANRFFSAVLIGLKNKQRNDTAYYSNLLQPMIKPANSYTFLHGLGFISRDNETDKANYFNLLQSSFNAGILSRGEFIRLCGIFEIHNQSVYSILDPISESDEENKEDITVLIEYLQRGQANLDRKWFAGMAHYVFSRSHADYTQSLNYLLTLIAEFDLPLAYEVFTFRLQVMGGIELLENGLSEMIRKDFPLFQTKFIGWLATDDKWIHNSILHITSATSLDKSVFACKPEVFNSLTDKVKLFVAYKIVGYVYSMEILQSLLISLAKSINSTNEFLKEAFYFIFSNYLVYNYRGTLPLLEKELKEAHLLPFSRELFEKVCAHYESYFAGLKNLAVNKEIRPYKEHSQLHNFYYRKLFAEIPKKAERNSLMSLFKKTQVNANNWAIRRPNELKHTPAPLGHISISSEFPSGEKLNPIYQELIRRTYQKIEMNEINID